MTIFDEIKAAGIEHGNHASDLYVPDTEQVRAILKRYPEKAKQIEPFTNQITGKPWLSIYFEYMPYFEEKAKRPVELETV